MPSQMVDTPPVDPDVRQELDRRGAPTVRMQLAATVLHMHGTSVPNPAFPIELPGRPYVPRPTVEEWLREQEVIAKEVVAARHAEQLSASQAATRWAKWAFWAAVASIALGVIQLMR